MRSILACAVVFMVCTCMAGATAPEGPLSSRQIEMIRANVATNLCDCCCDIREGTIQLIIDLKDAYPDINLDNAIIPLMRVLKNDDRPEMRIFASVALMHFNSELARFAVSRRALYDTDPRVAKQCETIARVMKTNTADIVVAPTVPAPEE